MSTFTTVIQHRFGSPSHRNQRIKRNKWNSNWKRNKTITVSDDIILLEYPKDNPRKLLELTKNLVKLQDKKLIHRNSWHFYILTMKETPSHLPPHQNNKILRNIST